MTRKMIILVKNGREITTNKDVNSPYVKGLISVGFKVTDKIKSQEQELKESLNAINNLEKKVITRRKRTKKQ